MNEWALDELVALLKREGIRRFYLVTEGERVRASHPALSPLAEWMAACPDYADHEGFFVELGTTGALHGACIHRTCRGQGAGGVRYWRYDSVGDYLTDGLRLARGMTHKNALAGLWWGGGKGVLAKGLCADEDHARRAIYEEYGAFITSLRGCYVTAEDVGTSVEDMAAVFSQTRFTTCIPPRLGGSGNPSIPTARGVLVGMQAALEHRGEGGLEGKTIAVQGLGHVGAPLTEMLLSAGAARVIGSDVDPAAAALADRFSGKLEVRIVPRGDRAILAEPADVVAPCAVGGVLDAETIPRLRAPLVCGAANNQLADPEADDRRLFEAGITYVPDFLVNRMGIVTCADEAFGYVDDDPAIAEHLGRDAPGSIHRVTREVLRASDAEGVPPGAIALGMAEERSRQLHPIWGHRGKAIIRSLVARGWERG